MVTSRPSIVGFIPARAGSTRVKDKNIRPLGSHPTMAYAIASALESGIFSAVISSTDSEYYAEIAHHYGAEIPFLRPKELAVGHMNDTPWLKYTLDRLSDEGRDFDCFALLRASNPFRLASTIRRAWELFRSEDNVDSLRAVERCNQHPAKMWVVRGRRMMPLLPIGPEDPDAQPWYNSAYQILPEIFVQNASLEIAKCSVLAETGTYSGRTMMPFVTEGYEGFDVNFPEDWIRAEQLVETGTAVLPAVSTEPFPMP